MLGDTDGVIKEYPAIYFLLPMQTFYNTTDPRYAECIGSWLIFVFQSMYHHLPEPLIMID